MSMPDRVEQAIFHAGYLRGVDPLPQLMRYWAARDQARCTAEYDRYIAQITAKQTVKLLSATQ